MSDTTTKPYFMRAIYEWCTDNGYTPYLAVKVNGLVKVPMEFVRNGEIVLNISFGATSGLKMDNNAVTFNARFGGVSREIYVPIANVAAIYASENSEGMAFEVDLEEVLLEPPSPIVNASETFTKPSLASVVSEDAERKAASDLQKKSEKPSLRIIK